MQQMECEFRLFMLNPENRYLYKDKNFNTQAEWWKITEKKHYFYDLRMSSNSFLEINFGVTGISSKIPS